MGAQNASSLCFNEVMVANIDQHVDPCWNYGAWVEVYNSGEKAKLISGYWLSDDAENLKKFRILSRQMVPGKGFLVLWFDNYSRYAPTQMDLKLDADGGFLYLSDTSGSLLTSIQYPPAVARSSFARMTDGGEEWGWTSAPTPAASNAGMSFAEKRLSEPEVSHQSGFYTMPLKVEVGIPQGCTLRYTTDGSTPSRTKGQTSTDGKFEVTSSSVYRFVFVADGSLSSKVVTRSFLAQPQTFTIPVISIASDPENLYSDQMGIMVKGTNGRPGRGISENCNWNQDWERPCNFEFLLPDGTPMVNQETWISRCGGWSRANTPCSFKIHATKVFEGEKTLDYPFFDGKPYLKHKMLQFRNGGNDYVHRVKDAFLQQLVATSGLNVDHLEYFPVAHYINGTYYGTINMREPSNKHHVYANYGLDDDEIDLYEIDADSGYVQKCGTDAAWLKLCEEAEGVVYTSAYQKVLQQLDVEAFCNYMAVQLYLGNTDWPKNNLKAFRPIAEGGRFRFVLYDLDHSFYTSDPFTHFVNCKTHTFNALFGEPVTNIVQEVQVVGLFQNLMKNGDFRKRFIDTFCLVAGSVFEPERCREEITRWASRVEHMQTIPNAYGTNASPWPSANSVIAELQKRQAALVDAMKNYTPLRIMTKKPLKATLKSSVPDAQIKMNGLNVPTGRFNGLLVPPVVLKAEPLAGHCFMGWKQGDHSDGVEAVTLLPFSSAWSYYDKGSLDGVDWTSPSFASTEWASGVAPLGYGNIHSYATTLNYGPLSEEKRPTYYFRSGFQVEKLPQEAQFKLDYRIDDGMVVYVNGKEAGRHNMPAGKVTYRTFSTDYAGNDPISGSLLLDRSLFHAGENVIAVEVHNNSFTSSDIHWDACLQMLTPEQHTEDDDYWSREAEVKLPQREDSLMLTACYRKLSSHENTLRPVVINEVSAGNSIYMNDYHKKADWVELYNTTDVDIDLEGYCLSDDVLVPGKYRIGRDGKEINTVIPAKGYKIIWCDKQYGISQLHANFKLSNADGAAVVLTSADGLWADTLVYCAHDGGQTVGRYPDASDSIYLMTRPTIDKRNVNGMYDEKCNLAISSDNTDGVFNAHQGGLRLAYSNGCLLLKNEEASAAQLLVTNLSGMVVMRREMPMHCTTEKVRVDLLRRGVYVATLTDEQGNRCTIKFSI